MENLKMHTPDLAEENFKKLAVMFPNAVTETINENGEVVRAIDADVLRQEISASVVEGVQERYQFTWPDKKKSVVLANQPIAKTLRLDREKSVGKDGTPGSIDTENIYIEGDNLDALKLLQETYLGKIKLIYIDPPYNTGSDFVYEDDFSQETSEYMGISGQFDKEGNQLVQNTESNGRFHTDWLNMLYPRLRIAKDLLSDDGILCISIDDNELYNLKKICDDVFGADNFVNNLVVKMSEASGLKMSHVETRIPKLKEYVVIYKKKDIKLKPIKVPKESWDREYRTFIDNISDDDLEFVKSILTDENRTKADVNKCNEILSTTRYVPVTEKYREAGITDESEKVKFNYDHAGRIFQTVSMGAGATKSILDTRKEVGNDIFFVHITAEGKGYLIKGDYDVSIRKPRMQVLFAEDYLTVNPCDFWQDIKTTGLDNEGYVPFKNGKKPLKLIQRLLELNVGDNDTVLDFFSGSGTTGEAIFRYNLAKGSSNKFILVQLPEVISEKELAFKEGYRKITELAEDRLKKASEDLRKSDNNVAIDLGYRVFKVDTSNMEDVYYRPADYEQGQMSLFANNIKEDRTPEDLLFQVMLDLGILLSSDIEETEIAGKKVFSVAGGYLIACFDDDVTEETVKEIAQRHPFYAVFRDSGMASDSVATNFEQIFETYSPKTQRKVL